MTLPAVPPDRRGASLPPLFVPSMFFPGKPPGLLGGGGEASSGPGWQIVFYWVLSSATVKHLKGAEDDWPPHLALWKRYVRDADRDLGFNGAMKGVAQADNMKNAADSTVIICALGHSCVTLPQNMCPSTATTTSRSSRRTTP